MIEARAGLLLVHASFCCCCGWAAAPPVKEALAGGTIKNLDPIFDESALPGGNDPKLAETPAKPTFAGADIQND